MGVAANNRGSKSIARGISEDYNRDSSFEIMDRINAIAKVEIKSSLMPARECRMENAIAYFDRGVWFIASSKDKYGSCMWYKSLSDLVQSWDMSLVGYNADTKEWKLA